MYYSNICMLRIEESHTKVELTTRNLCLHWSFLLQARRGSVNFLKLQHRKEKKIWSWLNVGSRCSKFFISIALYLTESPFASISFPKVIYFFGIICWMSASAHKTPTEVFCYWHIFNCDCSNSLSVFMLPILLFMTCSLIIDNNIMLVT